MIYKAIVIVLFLVAIFGCNNTTQEDPFNVAKGYCNCVEEEMKKYKDSLIDIYGCEKKVFPESRLMKINMSFNAEPYQNKYSEMTLDSARKFSSKVLTIIDTMCINKFDPKRIKKLPHIPM